MTVNPVNAFQLFEGDGVVTAFPFSFPLSTGASVKALRLYPNGLSVPLEPSEFSVVLDGSGVGGVLTTTLGSGPLPLGEKLYVYRETPASQLVSVTGQTSYDPIVVMRVWDKLTMLVQEVQAKLARAALVSPDADPVELLASIMQAVVDAETAAEIAVVAAAAAETFDPALYLPLASTTEAGRTLMAGTNAAAQQTTLGLVIGTDVQANLGFTPVEQGGGTDMGNNKVRLGWRTDGSGIQAQVDEWPIGVLATMADLTPAAGAVRSYAFCRNPHSLNYGDIVAGSSLQPAQAAHTLVLGGGSGGNYARLGAALSGTWRCLGTADSQVTAPSISTLGLATLYQRIA